MRCPSNCAGTGLSLTSALRATGNHSRSSMSFSYGYTPTPCLRAADQRRSTVDNLGGSTGTVKIVTALLPLSGCSRGAHTDVISPASGALGSFVHSQFERRDAARADVHDVHRAA